MSRWKAADRKHIRELMKHLSPDGWYVHRLKKHLILSHPSGAQIALSATPGGSWYIKQAIATAKRAIEKSASINSS